MAISAASWHIAVISAPEYPSVCAKHQSRKSCIFKVLRKTYEGSQCIEIERNFDGHIARANTKYVYATSKIRGSHV
jgi:hypothetical protein